MHEGTRGVLGIEPENVTMEKLVEVLLPEEREPLAKKESVVVDFFMNHLKPEEALDYKSVYFFRIKDAAGKTRDMLHQATILTMTSCKKPEFVLVVHTDVSHLKFMKRNNLSFISLTGGKSYFDIDIGSGLFNNRAGKLENSVLRKLFTKREKEVISLIGRGFSASKIAETLNISVHTVRTHRKNLLRKSDCSNTTELVARCLVEGLI